MFASMHSTLRRSVLGAAFALVVAIVLFSTVGLWLALTGCATGNQARPLDPSGAYAGDTLLHDVDGIMLEVEKTCDEVAAWAARNPEYVAAHRDAQKIVARCAAEVDAVAGDGEVLRTLLAVREAYVVAKTSANAEAVRREISVARSFLAVARGLVSSTSTL